MQEFTPPSSSGSARSSMSWDPGSEELKPELVVEGSNALTVTTSSPTRLAGSRKTKSGQGRNNSNTAAIRRAAIAKRDNGDNRLLATVSSGPAQQSQMLSSFLQVHFPSAEAKADLKNRQSYLLTLPDIDLSDMPLLRNAMSMVCYAHLGSQHKDQRLIQEAKHAYGKTLTTLVPLIHENSQRYDPKMVFTSMMLLTLYDEALPSSNSDHIGWKAHYKGAQAYLKAKGPDCLDTSQHFDKMVFSNLRQPALFIALVERKSLVLGAGDWHAIEKSRHPLFKSFFEGARLASILERVEISLSEGNQRGILQLWNDARDVQREINKSMSDPEVAGGDIAMLERNLLHISDLEHFDMSIEEQCFMTTNPTFRTFFHFSDPTNKFHLKVHTVWNYWLLALIADCILLRMLHFHPWLAQHCEFNIFANIERHGFKCATDMCRSAHDLSNRQSQAYSSWLAVLNQMAQNYFEEVGAMQEFSWCQALGLSNQLRYTRMLSTQPKSLCRVRDLQEGFGSLARFRAGGPARRNQYPPP